MRLVRQGKALVQRLAAAIPKRKFLPASIERFFFFVDFIFPAQAAPTGRNVRNLRILIPAQRVTISSPETDPFVPIGRLYREGWFDRPDIFVCEVPEAFLCIANGIVCTRDMEVLIDIEPRRHHFQNNAYRKPPEMRKGKVKRLAGLYSSINYFAAGNFFHWMIDCLPKLHSLAQYEPKATVTLLMPDSMSAVHRESLECVLPSNFRVEYRAHDEWLQVETFLYPSLIGSYYNGFLPAEYNDSIRRPVFERYNLPSFHSPRERLYLSRQGASRRCVLNEEAVITLLKPYGFKTVELDKLSFRDQVELFHRAEVLVGPSGAGFNLMMFCGNIPVVVLHPNRTPDNYFHTMAQSLGQRYHYVLHDGAYDDNFEADLPALERVLKEELSLMPRN